VVYGQKTEGGSKKTLKKCGQGKGGGKIYHKERVGGRDKTQKVFGYHKKNPDKKGGRVLREKKKKSQQIKGVELIDKPVQRNVHKNEEAKPYELGGG